MFFFFFFFVFFFFRGQGRGRGTRAKEEPWEPMLSFFVSVVLPRSKLPGTKKIAPRASRRLCLPPASPLEGRRRQGRSHAPRMMMMPPASTLLLQRLSWPLSPCSRPRISPWRRSRGSSLPSSRLRGKESTRRREMRGISTMSEEEEESLRRRWNKASQRRRDLDACGRGLRWKRRGRTSWLFPGFPPLLLLLLLLCLCRVSLCVERKVGGERGGCSLPSLSLSLARSLALSRSLSLVGTKWRSSFFFFFRRRKFPQKRISKKIRAALSFF